MIPVMRTPSRHDSRKGPRLCASRQVEKMLWLSLGFVAALPVKRLSSARTIQSPLLRGVRVYAVKTYAANAWPFREGCLPLQPPQTREAGAVGGGDDY